MGVGGCVMCNHTLNPPFNTHTHLRTVCACDSDPVSRAANVNVVFEHVHGHVFEDNVAFVRVRVGGWGWG